MSKISKSEAMVRCQEMLGTFKFKCLRFTSKGERKHDMDWCDVSSKWRHLSKTIVVKRGQNQKGKN